MAIGLSGSPAGNPRCSRPSSRKPSPHSCVSHEPGKEEQPHWERSVQVAVAPPFQPSAGDVRFRQAITKERTMPVWHIYHPENAYTADDKIELGKRITN